MGIYISNFLLFRYSYNICDQVGGLDIVCPVYYMTNFRGFRSGLEFGLPGFRFFVEGHEIFLKLSSEVIDILLGAVEHEYCIEIKIPCVWGDICVPLTKIRSIKEGPDIFSRKSF